MKELSKPRRQLGLFDDTMIVMGGIVGAGIFANPSEVAHRVHTPFLILGIWVLGGLTAMRDAFIRAKLATRLPGAGGQYVYLREARLRVLGPAALDATTTPASDLLWIALGERGAQWIAAGIVISTLGFLSQSILTAPRVYYGMARDGLFFESVGKLFGQSGAPVVAIVLQGLAATMIACSGRYVERF